MNSKEKDADGTSTEDGIAEGRGSGERKGVATVAKRETPRGRRSWAEFSATKTERRMRNDNNFSARRTI